jgi:hypothetical protein
MIRVLLVLLIAAVPAFAGTIYGTLRFNGEPVGMKAKVVVTCGREQYSAGTDEYGSYNVAVPPGRCGLEVMFADKRTRPYPVATSDDPARYDFDLVYEDGALVLKRR